MRQFGRNVGKEKTSEKPPTFVNFVISKFHDCLFILSGWS